MPRRQGVAKRSALYPVELPGHIGCPGGIRTHNLVLLRQCSFAGIRRGSFGAGDKGRWDVGQGIEPCEGTFRRLTLLVCSPRLHSPALFQVG